MTDHQPVTGWRSAKRAFAEAVALFVAAVLYLVPFYFVIINSFKTRGRRLR